jgi:hypothetical protein
MTRPELLDKLLDAPKHLFSAEAGLMNAEQCHRSAKEALADREASLLIEGLDGKSADVRQAQLREKTESLRAQVEETRVHVEFMRLSAESERAKFSALRASARLMAVEDLGMAEVLEQLAKVTAAQAQANIETGRHLARLEEAQEAHARAIEGLLGEREDTGREAEARAELANRVLQMEATVGQHGEAICRLLLVTAPLSEQGDRELPRMEGGA